jgi:AcrR family transcriptional regulator
MHNPFSYAILKGVTTEARNVTDKRTVILEATIQVLRERGLSGLKVEEVAKRAEVGKGTVYLYFEHKQDLLKALVEHHTMRFYADAAAITELDLPFPERLQKLLERRLSFVDEWRGLWSAVAREADPKGQRAWLTGLHQRYQGILERFVEAGVMAGELRANLNVPLTAATIAAVGCSPQLDFPRSEFIANLVEVFMKGVSE